MKKFKNIQLVITYSLVLIIGGLVGYYVGTNGYEVKIKQDSKPIEITNKERDLPSSVDFEQFWVVWDSINQRHIKRPLNPELLVEGAIKGMVSAIGDPYTTYLNIEENKETRDSLNGKYEGIGAQLGYDDQSRLIIIAPLDGSPAEIIGIKAGDKIMKIEGVDTMGISVSEAVSKIRGAAGTPITLTIIRDDQEPRDVTIIRDTIKVESVKWEDKGDGIAYIRLSRFGETTNSEWTKAVNEITTQMPNLKGIILDVRNNPGGFLESAVFIGSEFIGSGTIVKEDFSDGTSTDFKVDHAGKFVDKDLDVAVIVNSGSASASEIVAGALKEKVDAVIVGERSFGKGTVQSSQEYPDGTALHVTIAKWLTPDGNWIDKHNSEFKDSIYNEKTESGEEIKGGIKPDYAVEVTEEDVNQEIDAQLNKAIEVLKEFQTNPRKKTILGL